MPNTIVTINTMNPANRTTPPTHAGTNHFQLRCHQVVDLFIGNGGGFCGSILSPGVKIQIMAAFQFNSQAIGNAIDEGIVGRYDVYVVNGPVVKSFVCTGHSVAAWFGCGRRES